MIIAVTINLEENIMDITWPRCKIRLVKQMKEFERLIQAFRKKQKKEKTEGHGF
jgi:hypothetical protein